MPYLAEAVLPGYQTRMEKCEWRADVALTDKTLESGERVKAPTLLSSRIVEGKRIYRRPTDDEQREYVAERNGW